jgi:hypothetical protein
VSAHSGPLRPRLRRGGLTAPLLSLALSVQEFWGKAPNNKTAKFAQRTPLAPFVSPLHPQGASQNSETSRDPSCPLRVKRHFVPNSLDKFLSTKGVIDTFLFGDTHLCAMAPKVVQKLNKNAWEMDKILPNNEKSLALFEFFGRSFWRPFKCTGILPESRDKQYGFPLNSKVLDICSPKQAIRRPVTRNGIFL